MSILTITKLHKKSRKAKPVVKGETQSQEDAISNIKFAYTIQWYFKKQAWSDYFVLTKSDLPASEHSKVKNVCLIVVDKEVQIGIHSSKIYEQSDVFLVDGLKELKLQTNRQSDSNYES